MFGFHGRKQEGYEGNIRTRGGLMYYQQDALGNVMDVTDRIGDTVMKYRYDAFGNLFTQMAAPYNTVGFTGKSYDAKASLMDYSARWYSPNYGRFITEDTFLGELDLVQTLNRYAYVGNNPVNYLDPTGNYYWCYAVINGVEYSHAPPCDDNNNRVWIDEEEDDGGSSGGSGDCTGPSQETLEKLKADNLMKAAGGVPDLKDDVEYIYRLNLDYYSYLNDPVGQVFNAWNNTDPTSRTINSPDAPFMGQEIFMELTYMERKIKQVDPNRSITEFTVEKLDSIYVKVFYEKYAYMYETVSFAIGFDAPKAATVIKGTSKIERFSPVNPGPLPKEIADTFRSGTYTRSITQEETILYRVYGGKAGELGSYWTRTKPKGPLQSVVDSALDQKWGNNATQLVQIKVPKGVEIFEGVAAPQGGLIGGGNQVWIKEVNPSWIVK